MVNFGRIDLNLLLTLDTLLSELNVTRAAQRLHLSQPSVSVQLAKLREIFADPLLLPGPRGMLPTARAQALREPLRQALESLAHAVAPEQPFAPLAATNTWRVTATDYSESTVVLPALHTLRTQAPGSRLAVLEMVPAQIARQAEQGDIDLAFHTRDGAPQGLHQRGLFVEQYVLAARAGHRAFEKPLTVSAFSQLEQVIISPDGGGFFGPTDSALSALGMTRRVVLSVPHFLFALKVLEKTDLVAMLPLRLVRDNPALQIMEPPVPVPGYEMVMYWHERVHRDPAHRWLRECILRSV